MNGSLKIILTSLAIFSILEFNLDGQEEVKINKYSIDITQPGKTIVSNQLKLGGTNSKNESIEVNNFYFLLNGKPFIPVTGEFHYFRYPNKYWNESIRKIKAGGINIIATYIFWNIHEENEGKFDWQGDKDIRKFIELCAKNDIKVIVRIGPFCHGEIRNGGLPDWLFDRNFNVRSNDPEYLAYVERLYNEIGKQLQGLYFKDGGPVIGIQLENEYQHSASPWALTYPGQPADWTSAERDKPVIKEGVSVSNADNPYAKFGTEHMRVLKALAEKAGMVVPIYTATGWGNAAVIENESIPVTAAYPYPTWVPVISRSTFYLFTDLQKTPDYAPVRYNPENYPSFPAEIGGGMISNYNRRPTVPSQSLDALINRFLGSGSNAVGYYMFHGGATPKGDKYFFSDEAYGYTKINYDYQAPIGEYGQINASFHRLKLIHFFLNSFGERLAPMSLYLPETNTKIIPSDSTTLRYSVRSKDGSGFVFMQNFQDYQKMEPKENVQIYIKTRSGNIVIPESTGLNLRSEENLILPFNFNIEGVNLIYATAQILTRVGSVNKPCFVFFVPEGTNAEFSFSNVNIAGIRGKNCTVQSNKNRWLVKCERDAEITMRRISGGEIKILVVDKKTALKSWVIKLDRNYYLAFSDATLLDGNTGIEYFITGNNTFNLSFYPKVTFKPYINRGIIKDISELNSVMTAYRVEIPEFKFDLKTGRFGDKKLQLTYPDSIPAGINDVFIEVNYIGDTGMCFMNGDLVDDNFYFGHPWIIGLKKFYDVPMHKQMNFYFRPMYRNATYLLDLDKKAIPDFGNVQTYIKVNDIKAVPEYSGKINFR